MHSLSRVLLGSLLSICLAACSTWDSLSRREKDAAIGAAVGGVVGGMVTDGNPLGTLGGAAAGGVIGNEVSKSRGR